MDLETSVCGFKEPFLFWLWSNAAGAADASRLAGLTGIEDVSIKTGDQRQLLGYRLASRQASPRGYLLVLQGNAILADQLIGEFDAYAKAGYDVYMFDYRGYGRSQGKRRLKAIVSDVRDIINAINAKPYARHLVYAFSFGGIVLLDADVAKLDLHRVVIDSSPSRLSDHGCPLQYDPIEHLPKDCSNFLFIAGQRDTVVTPAMSNDLLKQAKACRAKVNKESKFAHPFMDADHVQHLQRMKSIKEFLLH